jgi:hypothetical protein
MYETLVKSVRRRLKDLTPVFERYCSLGDVMNVTSMSLPNFKKFGQDCGLIVDQATSAAFDLLFAKTTRRLAGVNPRLTLQSFVATIARLVLDRTPDLAVDDVLPTVSAFFATYISKASRWEPLPPVEDLLEPEVVAALQKDAGFLNKVRRGVARVPLLQQGIDPLAVQAWAHDTTIPLHYALLCVCVRALGLRSAILPAYGRLCTLALYWHVLAFVRFCPNCFFL